MVELGFRITFNYALSESMFKSINKGTKAIKSLSSKGEYKVQIKTGANVNKTTKTLVRNESVVEGTGEAVDNAIINLDRTGSALKDDYVYPVYNNKNQIINEFPATAKAHGFTDIIDNYAGDAVHTVLDDGADLYQILGSNNGVSGRFEWIVDGGNVTHRMFIEGGTINGLPTLP